MPSKAAYNFLTLLVLLAAAPAQDTMHVDVNAAKDTFHVNVNLVNLGFVARDSQGKLVSNLTADDIELFEDAVPQKIHSFSKSTDLPLTLALIVDASGSQDHFGKEHQKALEVFLKEVLRPAGPGVRGRLWKPLAAGERLHQLSRASTG